MNLGKRIYNGFFVVGSTLMLIAIAFFVCLTIMSPDPLETLSYSIPIIINLLFVEMMFCGFGTKNEVAIIGGVAGYAFTFFYILMVLM